MSQEPKVTCTQCKDLDFARNLVRQMKDGNYGRHNSNRGDYNAPTPERVASNFRFRTVSEIGPERILGRYNDGKIRDLMLECQVGDCVISDDPDPPNKIYTYLVQRAPPDFVSYEAWTEPLVFRLAERWLFEHVAARLTPDNGLTWEDRYFWRRIE